MDRHKYVYHFRVEKSVFLRSLNWLKIYVVEYGKLHFVTLLQALSLVLLVFFCFAFYFTCILLITYLFTKEIFAFWVILHHLIFLLKFSFTKTSFRNAIDVSNRLDPDQTRQNIGTNLGPNCLKRLSVDNSSRQRLKKNVDCL